MYIADVEYGSTRFIIVDNRADDLISNFTKKHNISDAKIEYKDGGVTVTSYMLLMRVKPLELGQEIPIGSVRSW